jgi:hypothetical protein
MKERTHNYDDIKEAAKQRLFVAKQLTLGKIYLLKIIDLPIIIAAT